MRRPILFNSDMVRAILEGRKTVTRRVIKSQWNACPNCHHVHNEYIYDSIAQNVYCACCGYPLVPERKAPYHQADVLYVRETWKISNPRGDYKYGTRKADLEYKADGHLKGVLIPREWEKYLGNKWHPSIHMPKEAARIWLQVTDVRIERLQKITLDQIEKEGVEIEHPNILNGREQQYAFSQLWDSTVNKLNVDCYGWAANPWVWVIEFERCEKPEPCILRGVEPTEEKRPCIGYGDAWADEPCEMCKGCSQCTGNDEEAER